MMAGCMGGGIGATQVFGWPLSDWAVLLLLFVVSVLIVALVGALIGVIASWFRRSRQEGATPSSQTTGEPAR